jgi:glucokinase
MATIVGVDVGGTLLRAAAFDEDLTLLDRAEQNTKAAGSPDAVLDRLYETIRQVLPESPDDLLGIGVALPGPLSAAEGILIAPPNLPMRNVPIARLIHEAVGGTVYIGNDADLAGLGEYTLGAGRDVDNLIYITISTGIGGGLIERGQILTGRGLGGEVGHMVIEPGGPICNCGKQGHLEAVASGTAIGRDARQRLATGEESLLLRMVDGDIAAITAREVGEAALQGDHLAQLIIDQAGRYIGMSIASLMMLLNPDMFVLGGGVTRVGDLLFDPINKAVREYAMHPRYYEDIPIVPAKLGADVGLYGAAALVQLKARS